MVSFTLNDEQEALRGTVGEFAREVVAPVIAGYYERGEFPYEIVAKMGKLGLFGLPFPEEYGGMGGDYFAFCIALHELARVDSSVAITLEAAVGLGAMPIYRFGSAGQRAHWLPALCQGERLAAFGLTEPGGGSDIPGGMRTTARLEAGEWVIDGSKALRAAIERVFGERVPVQRCRAHKLRNVREHLPRHLQAQVSSAMRAAFRLAPEEGIAKLKQQASWLEREYPDAAGSLREGMEELFTINQLGLSPSLCRALGSTNIIENPNSSARRKTHRVTRWRDGEMVKRWAAAAFLDAEQSFRRILGYRDLWMLKAILNEDQVANEGKAA